MQQPNIIDEVDQEVPDADPTEDEAFVEGVNFARKILYEDGMADKVNSIIKKHADPASQFAILAYELSAKADEATGGKVQDDNLISLGGFVLAEIGEIAEASGMEVKPTDMAAALKQMLTRYVEESGLDPSSVSQAMNEISKDQFTAIHDKVIGMGDEAA